jgi:hypothetical protein
MKRQIKFRVWSPKAKKFITSAEMDGASHYYSIHGQCFDTWDSYYRGYGDDWEIQQYTGLKDKNGKDVYEGDVVEVTCKNGKLIYPVNFGVIEGPMGTGLSQCFYYGADTAKFVFSEKESVEVIGNIHENPELLKK